MFPSQHHRALRRTLQRSYLEVIPAKGIGEKLKVLPHGAWVAITCSPSKPVEATLDLAERLDSRGLRLIPHIAARMVKDRSHLTDILARLDEMQIHSIFVPGGDRDQPLGDYACALDLLRDMAELGHRIPDVGVTAYPEGHPAIDDNILVEALLAKQSLATYFVTQMCFDAGLITRWLADMRARGLILQAWLGLPGVAERSKLLSTSLRIGVGDSARFITKQPSLAARLMTQKVYRPDDLLMDLAPSLDDPLLHIAGFHLYSFNQVENTETWRKQTLDSLEISADE
ncbi:MAG: methylenetetrahydrofolate reductase [Gammaproteobacteria bacterium]|jgi:methylenetetrahydrofolate reductase (NADPH)|nr:methylenetetrahydrofolate reductase [Gammaproteobacteria bacterium]